MSPPSRRRWTLDAARAMLDEVRARTARAAEAGGGEADSLDERIRAVVDQWARAMEALGLEVKGLWLVDFDNGEGYYCWKWPEEDLSYFHGYEEGFEGRIRIQ